MPNQLTLTDLAARLTAPDEVQMWDRDPWHPDGGRWVAVRVTARITGIVYGIYNRVTRDPCGTGCSVETETARLPLHAEGTWWHDNDAHCGRLYGGPWGGGEDAG